MKRPWLIFYLSLLLLPFLLLFSKLPFSLTRAQQSTSLPRLLLTDASTLPSNPDQTFSLNLESGEEFDLNVYLYPDGQPITAVDLQINFDPKVASVTAKTETTLFPLYVEPVETGWLDSENGHIQLSALTFDSQTNQPTSAVTQAGKLVTFHFQLAENLSPQTTLITFTPETIDPQNPSTTDTNLVSLTGPENHPQDVLGFVNRFQLIINQPGDLNGDSRVDLQDFYLISHNYGLSQNFELRADVNRDGRVDLQDFYQISQNYGKTY